MAEKPPKEPKKDKKAKGKGDHERKATQTPPTPSDPLPPVTGGPVIPTDRKRSPLSDTTLGAVMSGDPFSSIQSSQQEIVTPDAPVKSNVTGVGIGEGTHPWKYPTETETEYRERMDRLGLPYKLPEER